MDGEKCNEIDEWFNYNTELVACYRCSHLSHDETGDYCNEPNSKHYWNRSGVIKIDCYKDIITGIPEPEATELAPKRLKIGCKHLDFDTEPISEDIFNRLPKGSFLRRRKYTKSNN